MVQQAGPNLNLGPHSDHTQVAAMLSMLKEGPYSRSRLPDLGPIT